ncbi:hypothetical protein BASA81_002640 [Batrachochytrium salamandrivorans]|nr:hypothetical protein BASA81_002640 [Batrachochytrium salamandrivorans]
MGSKFESWYDCEELNRIAKVVFAASKKDTDLENALANAKGKTPMMHPSKFRGFPKKGDSLGGAYLHAFSTTMLKLPKLCLLQPIVVYRNCLFQENGNWDEFFVPRIASESSEYLKKWNHANKRKHGFVTFRLAIGVPVLPLLFDKDHEGLSPNEKDLQLPTYAIANFHLAKDGSVHVVPYTATDEEQGCSFCSELK